VNFLFSIFFIFVIEKKFHQFYHQLFAIGAKSRKGK